MTSQAGAGPPKSPESLGHPPAGPTTPEPSGSVGAPQPVEREFTIQARTQSQMVFRRFLQHRLAVASLVLFLALVIFAFVAPLFWQYNYKDLTNELSAGPSLKHPFGTDSSGLDEFAAVMRGTQRSV